jgi:NAD(P)H dehydrogenase (quinone)
LRNTPPFAVATFIPSKLIFKMTTQSKIKATVFGATGNIGSALLHFLSDAGVPTSAVTRTLQKAVTFPHVEWIPADISDQKDLPRTMEGSRVVFLLSAPGPNFVEQQHNVIQAAKSAGIAHLVKLSSGAVDETSPFFIPNNFFAKVHGEVETLLKASGVPWTILQPNAFMQNWLGPISAMVKKERKIYEATGDGKRAYLDTRDIAEAAAAILQAPGVHLQKTYLLTGGEAVNYTRVADILTEALGEKVQFVPLTEAKTKQRMEQSGIPPAAIPTLLAYAEAQRLGKAEHVSRAIPDLLGKPARTVEAFIHDHLEHFR